MRFTSIALVVAVITIAFPIIATAQNVISIDYVTNITDDSTLSGGVGNDIVLRYKAVSAPTGEVYWPANGWIIYSPDGADWGSVQVQTMPAFQALGFPKTFVNYFDKTGGSGSFGLPQATGGGNPGGDDTVGVVVAALFDNPGAGLPSGFNQVAVKIRVAPPTSEDGLHVCIDTSGLIPGASWEWANGTTGLIAPQWTGSRCWAIGCCAGLVGDADGENGDEPTIGDITRIIDFLYLTQAPLDCLAEADANLSGTLVNPPLDATDITIGDITTLIDHLYLTQKPLANCP